VVLAAVLLVARAIAERYDLPRASVEDILKATGASRSRTYELSARLASLIPTLAGAPGRPQKTPVAPSSAAAAELTRAVFAYVTRHPGCINHAETRHWYSDGFRRFAVELCRAHAELDVEEVAHAILVPLGTLKDWLRAPASPEESDDEPVAPPETFTREIQLILCAWRRWSGTFLDFCEHVRSDLGVPFGRDLIRRILETEGLRKTTRREGEHRPDEVALRGAFRTYFPGAQWVGDGLALPVHVGGERFMFNVELDVDAYTGAFVGVSVRDTEDSAAVVEAFESGITTTGAPPLALLLDNKPSNHTPDVDTALDETMRIRATPFRPQNKAHVEGAFGLFSSVLPALALDTTMSARELGRTAARLAVEIWARASNHRPRRDRGGRSRSELYSDSPSDEQIEAARRELRELLERQQLARRTAEARARPEVLALLDHQFARLALVDPERHIRIAIAGYPSAAIDAGVAIFASKRRASTLPDGADARYLLGIVRNISADLEAEFFAEELYDLRVELRDRILARLRAERDEICADADTARVANTCVDRALEIPASMERTFWLETLADVLRALPEQERKASFLWASRRIQATYAVPLRERQQVIRFVADRLVPLP
jgi:hypothetical protein